MILYLLDVIWWKRWVEERGEFIYVGSAPRFPQLHRLVKGIIA